MKTKTFLRRNALRLLASFLFLWGMTVQAGAHDGARKQLFDFDWKFTLGDPAEASSASFDDSDWRTLDLPHDWSVEGTISPDAPMGNDGGYFPAGIAWYRKTFEVPVTSQNCKMGIYFEGVYMNSEVFINGHSLGVRPYGYSSFFYDMTPYLHFGGKNVIAVRVDNSAHKNCRWYSGSGIYRHVWLVHTDKVHIAHWGTFITTPKVNDTQATVQVKTQIENETQTSRRVDRERNANISSCDADNPAELC